MTENRVLMLGHSNEVHLVTSNNMRQLVIRKQKLTRMPLIMEGEHNLEPLIKKFHSIPQFLHIFELTRTTKPWNMPVQYHNRFEQVVQTDDLQPMSPFPSL